VVEDINTRLTRLRTYDGERAVLPNPDVYPGRSLFGLRMISGVFVHDRYWLAGVLEEARSIIHSVLARTDGVLKDA
jgi:small conductance mechanosensitive channel